MGNSFSDAAQRRTLDAEIRGDMVQRDLLENRGMLFHQVKIALFGRLKKKTLRSVHGNIESLLRDAPAEVLPLVGLLV